MWLGLLGAVLIGAVLGWTEAALAYKAQLAWEPVQGAAGYMVYARAGSGAFGPPVYLGPKAIDSDGLIRHVVTGIPLGPTAYFAVSAYDETELGSVLSNQLSVSYAQAAPVVDSDGDGLSDAQEDANLNGVLDAGESDPFDADSPSALFCNGGTVAPGAPCDDGIACTAVDLCIAGTCRGTSVCGGEEFCNADTGQCELSPASSVWVTAADDVSAVFNGSMVVGTAFTNGADADPSADNLSDSLLFANSSMNAFDGGSGDEAEYRIRLPRSGEWYMWGRFYYPEPLAGVSNSFFVSVDDGPLKRFGNNFDFVEVWHWDGDGDVQAGEVAPLALGHLQAGFHKVTVEKREAGLRPPRLDMFVFTRNPHYRPTDAAAVEVLGECGDGIIGPGEHCDNGALNSDIDRYACRTDCSVTEVCGDANGDTFVNASDATVIMRATVGAGPACGPDCDVDGDGRTGATDAFLVLRHAIGALPALTCGY